MYTLESYKCILLAILFFKKNKNAEVAKTRKAVYI